MTEQTNPQAALLAAVALYGPRNSTGSLNAGSTIVLGAAEQFLAWLDQQDTRPEATRPWLRKDSE